MALGSSDETQVWLKYAFELGYITEQQLREWKETYGRISRMLQALYTSISGDR